MKNDIFRWSLYNVRSKKRDFIHLIISLFLVFSLLSVGLVYSVFIENIYKDVLDGSLYRLFLVSELPDGFSSDEYEEMSRYLQTQDIVSESALYSELDFIQYAYFTIDNLYTKEMQENKHGKILITLNGKKHELNFNEFMMTVNISDNNSNVISERQIELFKKNHSGSDPLKCGSYPNDYNEVLISEPFLINLGLNEHDISEICGKTIRFAYGDSEIIAPVTISGIVSSEFYENDIYFSNIIYLKEKTEKIIDFAGTMTLSLTHYDKDKTESLKDDLLSFYKMETENCNYYNKLDDISYQRKYVNKIILFIVFLILVCSVLNISVFLMMVEYQNRRQTALLLSQGMTLRKLTGLKTMELVYCIIIASAFCFAVIVAAVYFLSSLIFDKFYVNESVPFEMTVLTVMATCFVVSLIVILINIIIMNKQFKRKSICEILNS